MNFTDEERQKIFTEKLVVPAQGYDTCAGLNGTIHFRTYRLYALRGGLQEVVNVVPSDGTNIHVQLSNGDVLRTSWNEPFLFYIAHSIEEYISSKREGIHSRETLHDLYVPDLADLATRKMPT